MVTHVTCAHLAVVHHIHAVPLRSIGDTGNFLAELLILAVKRGTVVIGVGIVRRLHCEFTHTLQHVSDFAGRTFNRLQHGDTVVGIAHGLVQAVDLRGHFLADGEAGGIVFGGINARASRQLRHRLLQFAVVDSQSVAGDEGFHVGIDDRHFNTPKIDDRS